MVCTKETVKTNGLNIWSDTSATASAPEVDIIAVQGLGSHPFYTWVKKVPAEEAVPSARFRDKFRFGKGKSKGKQPEIKPASDAEIMWPRDLLVPLFPNARVATYSYKSDWRDPKIKASLRECANQFLNILLQHRRNPDEVERPLILIGHSLGGLIIQEALVIAVLQDVFADVRLSVAGIIFLGTPFQGSDAATYGKLLARVAGLDHTLLESLRKNSPSLHALSRDFWGSHSEWDTVCFYEFAEAKYGPFKTLFARAQSASIPGKRMMFLDADHSGLNKFSGMEDENFNLLLQEIQRMATDGPSAIAGRHRKKHALDHGNIGQPEPVGNVHWIVRRIVNNLFTGRTELLDKIRNALLGNETSSAEQRRFVVTGMGGQGKSEVCLKAANLMREEFWGVFWIDVDSPSVAKSDFVAAAKAIGQSVESTEEALQVLANTKKNWLLVLDNADDHKFDYQEYIPSGSHGAVIMTSRVTDCSRYRTVGSEALDGLGINLSRELLLKAADFPEDTWQQHAEPAEKVVDVLGSHTLALIQAGAYIAKGHSRLDQYPDVYQKQRKRLLKHRPRQAHSRYLDVYATFEASAEALERSGTDASRDALKLLDIQSMFHSSIFPLNIFERAQANAGEIDGCPDLTKYLWKDDFSPWHVSQLPDFMGKADEEWDDYRLVEASSLLESLSLVTHHSLAAGTGLSMHPLTHAWAKDRQDSVRQRMSWIAAGSALALSRPTYSDWQGQEGYLRPHIHSCIHMDIHEAFSSGPTNLVLALFVRYGLTLLQMRDDSALSGLLKQIFTEIKVDQDKPLEQYLPLFEVRARSLQDCGLSAQSAEIWERIIKIRQEKLNQNHPQFQSSLHFLAAVYQSNGQTEQAIELLQQVVKIRETTLAQDHPSRLASQHELAGAYLANRQIEQAIELLQQVVKIQETTLAQDHPSRLASQHELAGAYLANGQTEQAIELLEQVVRIKELMPNKDQVSQYTLAYAYKRNGQVARAVGLLERIVEIEKDTLAEDDPNRLLTMDLLARCKRIDVDGGNGEESTEDEDEEEAEEEDEGVDEEHGIGSQDDQEEEED